jgi:uncharacterized protein (TIGR03435 family)
MSNPGGIVMKLKLIGCALIGAMALAQLQPPAHRPAFDAFEVATVKPTPPDDYRGARLFKMPSAHQFIAKNYPLRMLIALAFNLPLRAISSGPDWIDSDHYDIVAATPGEAKPTLDEQMSMLQKLLADRFNLTFHREKKEFSIYAITIANNGPKLKQSTAPADEAPALISTVYPAASGGIDRVVMPGHNATVAQFASVLQRVVLDRPVVDQTGLSGKYDFELEWTPDETQFGGTLPQGPPDTDRPGLFAAVQQQLGLRLEATRGPIDTMVINRVEKPTEN